MEVLIAYDVSNNKHTEVKSAMEVKGFRDHVVKNGATHKLPETTLYHPNYNGAQDAVNILNAIVTNIANLTIVDKPTLTKVIAWELGACSTNPNKS